MDILWFVVKMMVYGFLIGLLMGLGALAYALITIHFEKGARLYGEEMNTSLQNGVKPSSGNG
jgi:hypothetical protein